MNMTYELDPVRAWALRNRDRESRWKLATAFIAVITVAVCVLVFEVFGAAVFGLYATVVLCLSLAIARLRRAES